MMMITKMNVEENGKKNCVGPAPKSTLVALSSLLLLILLIINIIERASGQQVVEAAPVEPGKRSFTGVMVVVAVLFFISGLLSLYTRQCTDRTAPTHHHHHHHLPPTRSSLHLPLTTPRGAGLNSDVIDSFPTFLYGTVKGLMVGKEALACAVCLDEFQDDQTLRLIPLCNHVFHPACIDAWLNSNATCPVCRANLVPTSPEEEEEPPFLAVEIPQDDDDDNENNNNNNNDNGVVVVGVDGESGKKEKNIVGRMMIGSYRMNNSNGRGTSTPRSRSTGLLFPRSEWVEGCEESRLSVVRLPEEVRRKLVENDNPRERLKRARSCVVSLGRMGSGKSGYRTRTSLGIRYERFHADPWDFPLTTTSSSSSQLVPDDHDRVLGDERSSHYLCPPGILDTNLISSHPSNQLIYP